MSKIRVLSVDDSALMRQIMTEIINSHSDMEMVATAPDPLVARDLIKKYNPDVLTLDVEMPRMDGIDFLEKLMRLRPEGNASRRRLHGGRWDSIFGLVVFC